MENREQTLATYIGDMYSLEQHLLEAFERQLDLTKDVPEAHRVVQQLVTSARTRYQSLEGRMTALTGQAPDKGVTNTVKSMVSSLLGVAAGAIDHVRPQSVSKALRDSYTATNLAIVGYVMLQTTGLALNDPETASLAERNLQDAVRSAQSIMSVIPALVIHDLQDDVGNVSATAVQQVTGNKSVSHLFGSSSSSSSSRAAGSASTTSKK